MVHNGHTSIEAADQKSDQTSSDETKEGSTSSNNISNQSDEKKPRIRLWPEDMEGPVPTKAVPQVCSLKQRNVESWNGTLSPHLKTF